MGLHARNQKPSLLNKSYDYYHLASKYERKKLFLYDRIVARKSQTFWDPKLQNDMYDICMSYNSLQNFRGSPSVGELNHNFFPLSLGHQFKLSFGFCKLSSGHCKL